VVALLGGKHWVEDAVRAIVAGHQARFQGVQIHLVFETKAADAKLVLDRIDAFGLPVPSKISLELLRIKLQGGRVLCVVIDGSTGFPECFQRIDFPDDCISDEFFEHMVVSRGKNSNLMEILHGKADQYPHLLYAWTGLRTMPAKVKKRFSGTAIEGPTARDVANMFKRWLLGD